MYLERSQFTNAAETINASKELACSIYITNNKAAFDTQVNGSPSIQCQLQVEFVRKGAEGMPYGLSSGQTFCTCFRLSWEQHLCK